MGSFFYLLTFLSHDPMYSTAADTSRRALLELPQVKRDVRAVKAVAEKKIQQVTGLTPEEIVYAAYVYPVVSGKISSKPFKNFKYNSKEYKFVVVPEVEYNFKQKTSNVAVFLIKEF